jgi:hypothetical protein
MRNVLAGVITIILCWFLPISNVFYAIFAATLLFFVTLILTYVVQELFRFLALCILASLTAAFIWAWYKVANIAIHMKAIWAEEPLKEIAKKVIIKLDMAFKVLS